jgi:hypothetical protein
MQLTINFNECHAVIYVSIKVPRSLTTTPIRSLVASNREEKDKAHCPLRLMISAHVPVSQNPVSLSA